VIDGTGFALTNGPPSLARSCACILALDAPARIPWMPEDSARWSTRGKTDVRVNRNDLAAGAIFIAIGLLYAGIAWQSLPMGSALRMGPGYFPIVLSGLLIALGGLIAARGILAGRVEPRSARVPWRGVIMLSLATIVFAAFFDDLGMLPGVFLSTLLATLSSPKIRLRAGVVTSICIAVFCTVVFSYGVGLPVPIFGPVFGR
jgi:hypothetical protein